jgi:hypothetical protein
MTTGPANQQAKGLARFFDEPELHILKHVRWFLTILGAAVVLHFVTDAAEEHHFPGGLFSF